MKYLSYIDYRNRKPTSLIYEKFIASHTRASWFNDNNNQALRPFLTVDEEKELWDKYIASGRKNISVRNTIVERYMWIAYYTAYNTFGKNIKIANFTLDDAVSEANIKLIQCVECFDTRFDNLFITYAVDAIAHYLQCVNSIQYGEFKLSHLMHSRRVMLTAYLEQNVLSENDTCDKSSLTKNIALYFKLDPSKTQVKYIVYLLNGVFGEVLSLNSPMKNSQGEDADMTLLDLIPSVESSKPQTVFSRNVETFKRFLIWLRNDGDYVRTHRCKTNQIAEEKLSQLIETRLFKYIGIDRDVDTGLYVYANKKSFQEIATETGFCRQAVEQWIHRGLLKPIFEKYDKDVLRQVIEEILRDDMSFEHAKMKLEKYKEKSI